MSKPAISFQFGGGDNATATIPIDYHWAMQAVVAAARTGNDILVRLALQHLDATHPFRWKTDDAK